MIPAVALLGTGVALAYTTLAGPRNLVDVRSRRNNKMYSVQNLPDKQEAADRMSEVHDNLEKLIEHYKSDTASSADPRVNVLVQRFRPENICENDISASSTSYSENKGDRIVICLRDKSPPHSLVDINTIMFVVLHEMAHLMTTTVGHTPEFWSNFRRILHDASSIQIYTPVNYARSPVSYCGMTITDSPL